MLKDALLSLLRTEFRRPLFAGLNLAGLAAGFATVFVIWTVVAFESSFDRWVPDASAVHRVDSVLSFMPGAPPQRLALTPRPLQAALASDFPQITAVAFLSRDFVRLRRSGTVEELEVQRTAPSFFQVFPLPFISGDASSALSRPGSAVLTETEARRLFGRIDVVGQALPVAAGEPLIVTGVLKDLPANTSLVLSLITTPDRSGEGDAASWASFAGETWIRLKDPASAADLAAGLGPFGDRRISGGMTSQTLRFALSPLTDLHFSDVTVASAPRPAVERTAIVILGAVGLLTLIVSAINYVNLSTARATARAREVGVRKTAGATRARLTGHFLLESLVLAAVAGLLGLSLAELALPSVNALLGASLQIQYGGAFGILVALAASVVLVGVVAGLYPALALSSFRPTEVLSSSSATPRRAGGGRLREALVIVQFAFAVGLSITAVVMVLQASELRTGDIGFDRDQLAVVSGLTAEETSSRITPLLTTLKALPGVEAATVSAAAPGDTGFSSAPVGRQGQARPVFMAEFTVGPDYAQTYGLRVLAGRPFDMERRQDDLSLVGEGPVGILINEAAARQLGYGVSQAVGQTVSITRQADLGAAPAFSGAPNAVIVGVVANARFGSPAEPVQPAYYQFTSDPAWLGEGDRIVTVRFATTAPGSLREDIGETVRQVLPDLPFTLEMMPSRLAVYHAPEARRSQLLTAAAILSVLIAALGLYGMAAYALTRRTREIGIRKALGASSGDVLRLLAGQFLRPVLVATLMSWPATWVLLERWLLTFDQRLALSPMHFAMGSAAAVFIAAIAVILQSVRAARQPPAEALRAP